MYPVTDDPPVSSPAIATAITNGHLTIGGPDNPPVIVNPTPIRPMHPRAQYPPQYSSTPRVNAGDIGSQPSSGKLKQQVRNPSHSPLFVISSLSCWGLLLSFSCLC